MLWIDHEQTSQPSNQPNNQPTEQTEWLHLSSLH